MKPKRIYRADSRLKGMAVTMSDGWEGKVVEDAGGGIIVCIGKGERRPNDHWVGDYRLVGPSKIRVVGNKAVVVWKSAAAASKPPGRSVVVDLARARLEHEWKSASGAT
jgi:hypothetical protein